MGQLEEEEEASQDKSKNRRGEWRALRHQMHSERKRSETEEGGKAGGRRRESGEKRRKMERRTRFKRQLHCSRTGLHGLLVLCCLWSPTCPCSKHYAYLMRPLQSCGKRDAGNSSATPPKPPPTPPLNLSPLSTFLFHNSPRPLLSPPAPNISFLIVL